MFAVTLRIPAHTVPISLYPSGRGTKCTWTCDGGLTYDLSSLKPVFLDPDTTATDSEGKNYFWRTCNEEAYKEVCSATTLPKAQWAAVQTWGTGPTDCAIIGDTTQGTCTVMDPRNPTQGM